MFAPFPARIPAVGIPPLHGTEELAVDEHLQRVPDGVDGELQPLAGLEELLAPVNL